MIRSFKSFAFAAALTCSVATGATLTAGIAAPVTAEAGILSSVKNAAKAAVKAPWTGTKIVANKVVLPVVKIAGKIIKKKPPIYCVRAPCSR